MTIPAWPTGLPYASQRQGFQTSQLDNPPLRTEMNAGTTRERVKTTLLIARQKVQIKLSISQIDVFHSFWKDTIIRGTQRFTMPVWTGSSYQTRTVKIVEGPAESNFGADQTMVSLTLAVEALI